MWRRLRILILLFILASVGLETWRAHARSTAWEKTLHVGLYPVAADASPATARYLHGLAADDFEEIETWLATQAGAYGRGQVAPIDMWLAPALPEAPPLPPRQADWLAAAWWSLKLRGWAWEYRHIGRLKPDIRLFLLYHDPARTPALPPSTGLARGKIGLIHVFAEPRQTRQNAVIIAHELLHTLGATDKYDLATLAPHYPDGYAEPQRQPLYPQAFAEIMGGRTPLAPHRAETPASLDYVLIGPATAREVGLLPRTP